VVFSYNSRKESSYNSGHQTQGLMYARQAHTFSTTVFHSLYLHGKNTFCTTLVFHWEQLDDMIYAPFVPWVCILQFDWNWYNIYNMYIIYIYQLIKYTHDVIWMYFLFLKFLFYLYVHTMFGSLLPHIPIPSLTLPLPRSILYPPLRLATQQKLFALISNFVVERV
jgi:hypothetical protein